MFSYLRYFFVISIGLIVAAAVFLSWYYKTAADEIISKQAEQNNIALAGSFNNSIWNDYKQVVKAFFSVPPQDRDKYQEFTHLQEFGRKMVASMQEIAIVRFSIYTPEGVKFISVDHSTINLSTPDTSQDITGDNSKDLRPEVVAASGLVESEIIYDANFRLANGAQKTGTLVRTLIPLTSDSYIKVVDGRPMKVDAVLEIFYDVSIASATLRNFQYLGIGFVIGIFAILFITLLYTTRRAEKIIEKQYETNIELASAKSRAETENQAKSQFLANISHELRTPLNAIIGFSEIIKDEVMGPLVNDQYKNYIRDIHGEGVHLLSLINDILDYSKAEAGKLSIESEDVDLKKMIGSCIKTQETRANNAGVQLEKQLPAEQIVIRTDAKKLRQILNNLLSNAVKFTTEKGSVMVTVWHNVSENNVAIEIKDTGIGIAPKDIAKALAPFGQVDSELSRKYEGTGLGLPLTKKFVELLGGEFKLESELNKGTTITVFLPYEASKSAPAMNYNPSEA